MVPAVRGSQGKIRGSGKVGKFYIPKSGKIQRVSGSQGILKYRGAKVHKGARKIFELLYADCVQQFKIFLFFSLRSQILNLFRHLCF